MCRRIIIFDTFVNIANEIDLIENIVFDETLKNTKYAFGLRA